MNVISIWKTVASFWKKIPASTRYLIVGCLCCLVLGASIAGCVYKPRLDRARADAAYYIEEAMSSRWPCHMMVTETAQVREGQPLAKTGSAGCSTGTHVHWEIHHQADRLDDYAARINPERYMRDARPPR